MLSEQYIVYNVVVKNHIDETPVHTESEIKELYTLLLTAPEVVNIEQHYSFNGLQSELRVIFWNKQEYDKFAERTGERYRTIAEKLNNNYENSYWLRPINFYRHTSEENYQSIFPYKNYLPASAIISWTLIEYYKYWFIQNIVPLGTIQTYKGNGKFAPTEVTGCRFIHGRSSSIERLPPSKKALEHYIDFITYHFDHVIEHALITNPYIYYKFDRLCKDVESTAEKYISSCENSVVLVGHQSLGEKITTHTHRLSDTKKFTVTIAVRLTFDDEPMVYKFYKPIPSTDPRLNKYYVTTSYITTYTNNLIPHEIVPTSRVSMFVFNAGYTPHEATYTNDLYAFFVYDNVTFKDGMLEEIKQQSQHHLFSDLEQEDHLYFCNI
jgi:hypothetical protein